MSALLGLPLMAIGLLGYTGVWRRWARNGFSTTVFGVFWWGVGLEILGLAVLLPKNGIFGTVFVIGACVAFLGLIFFIWTPPFLTPRWFRALRKAALGR